MSDAMWDRLIGPEANARIKREDEERRQAEQDARDRFMRDHTCDTCGAWLVDPEKHARWHGGVA